MFFFSRVPSTPIFTVQNIDLWVVLYRPLHHQETFHSEVLQESLALHEGGGILHLPFGPKASALGIHRSIGSDFGSIDKREGFRMSWDL